MCYRAVRKRKLVLKTIGRKLRAEYKETAHKVLGYRKKGQKPWISKVLGLGW